MPDALSAAQINSAKALHGLPNNKNNQTIQYFCTIMHYRSKLYQFTTSKISPQKRINVIALKY